MQNGIRKEGHGYYGIWINGEIVASAHNPKDAQAKFAKEEARAQMNAQRDASNTAWEAKRDAAQYSMTESQVEEICPDFYTL